MNRQQVIQQILEDFKGVKNIPGIESAKRRVLITKIKNESGEIITSRKGIANVFGEFYKKLYDDNEQDEYGNESNIDVHISDTEEMMRIPEITSEELQGAIRRLKKGKSPDSNGIRAEDIKACDDETREMGRQIFNEIIMQNEFTPEAWKKVRIKVMHKKGDVEDIYKLQPDLLVASVVQIVHDNTVQQIMSMTRPNASGRSGGIQKLLPNNRSSCDAQND